MKAAYIFLSPVFGISHLISRILPQLESDEHGLDIVALCFFDENALILENEHPYAAYLNKVAREKNITLLMAEKADLIRNVKDETSTSKERLKPTECTVMVVSNSAQVACFPNLYAALDQASQPDHIICL